MLNRTAAELAHGLVLSEGPGEGAPPAWFGAPLRPESIPTVRRAPGGAHVPFAPPPGTVIDGKYRILRTIGSGGMGVVVEAVHVTLGQRVAVKLVNGTLQSPRAMSRFLHEARVAAQLPGDHVVRAVDVGQAKTGEAYLVMELLVGRDLQAEIEARKTIPVSEAVDWVLQACEGTAEAHAVGLVHRDIKPANLFLVRRRDGSRLVKVLDFGISKWTLAASISAASTTNSAVGTPAYMAPEQFEPDGVVDARADQHALAVVLYELIAGATPFVAPSVYALALMISRKPTPPLRAAAPHAPAGLEAALARALAKDPADRFPDLGAFARAIAPFGGPGADASARNVTAILEAAPPAPPLSLTSPEPSPAASAPSTAPPAPPAPPVALTTPSPRIEEDLSQSLDEVPLYFGRARRRRMATVFAALLVAAAAVGAAGSMLGSPSDPGEAAASPVEPAPEAPRAPPAASPPPKIEPAPEASRPPPAAAASAPAASPVKSAPAPRRPRTATPREIFGARR